MDGDETNATPSQSCSSSICPLPQLPVIENDVDVYSLKGWHSVLDLEYGIEPKTPEARPAAILAPVAEVVVHPEPPVGNCHRGDRDGGIPGGILC